MSNSKIQQFVTTLPNECADNRNSCEPCSSKKTVAAIDQFVTQVEIDRGDDIISEIINHNIEEDYVLPPGNSKAAIAVRKAAAVLGCKSESCVIQHPRMKNFINKVDPDIDISTELRENFKAKGPRNSNSLLSNFNHEDVFHQWSNQFNNFYPYEFNMIDFAKVGGSLAVVNILDILSGNEDVNLGNGNFVKRPCNIMGCILNTDVSSGRGKHWVAIFIDARGKKNWTIEYFNSSGNPPTKEVVKWMEESKVIMETYRSRNPPWGKVKTVAVTSIRHQDSKTECGPYSLFYIRSRIEGTPYKRFIENRISDDEMLKFRKHLFRDK